jgi:hypothetical protein
VRFARKRLFFVALLSIVCTPMAQARHHARHAEPTKLSSSAINDARLSGDKGRAADRAAMVKAEVLLDRLALSPGVIDGKPGDNMRKAIAAFQQTRGLQPTG